MMKRFSEKQVVGFFKEAEAGVPAKELYFCFGSSLVI